MNNEKHIRGLNWLPRNMFQD